jgi:hypothetical protein
MANGTHNSAAHFYVPTMKTNVTLKLDADMLREVRIIAAQEGISISGFLASKLEEAIRERKSFSRSKRRALARLRNCTDHGWVRPASRDELHER